MEIYPRAEVKFYDFFVPYAEIVPFVEGNYKAIMQSQITGQGTENFLAWNSSIDIAAAKATENFKTCGVWYNWLAAMNGAASSNADPSGVQGVCPDGWHLPGDAEWTKLENYLIAGGYNFDGTISGNKIAKSLAATTSWDPSTTEGAPGNTDYPGYQNKTGFSALPGGWIGEIGGSFNMGREGMWWTSTEYSAAKAWFRHLNSHYKYLGDINDGKGYGFNVRCVKN
jgi:uncharacterized protein (TIGR02145 family)